MAIYPVQIPNRSTMYVEGTKSAITAKLKSLGYTKFTITEAISKTKLVTNRLGKGKIGTIKPIKVGSIPSPSARTAGAGKTTGGPNNPGMKPDLEAQSKRPDVIKKKKEAEADKKKKQQSNKRGGSGNQTKKNVKVGSATGNQTKKKVTPPVNKKTVGNKQKLNQKISELAKKVKSRAPNVSMSKITDAIRGVIRKRPLTAVSVAAIGGATVAMILKKLGPAAYLAPSKIGNQELKKSVSQPRTMPFKSKTKDKGSKPKSSSVSITIATPLPKPKRDKDTSKKKTDKGGSGMMFSLIVGGKGDSKARFKEIAAEKTLEKKLGRRPDKKELLAYLKKN